MSQNVEEELLCVTDAKAAIYSTIEMLRQNSAGQVIYPGEHKVRHDLVIKNLDHLRVFLIEQSDAEYNSSVPYDDGNPVWEADSEGWVDEIMAEKDEELRELGLS